MSIAGAGRKQEMARAYDRLHAGIFQWQARTHHLHIPAGGIR